MQKKPSAIVVGVRAEQGLGGALCRKFAAEGCHVFVAGRTSAKVQGIVASLEASGASAEGVVTDASNEANVVALFDRAFAMREALLNSSCSTQATISG